MAHSFFLHITWKTWASSPSIDARLAERLAQALPSLAIAEHAAIVELAIMPNHVHAVVELTPRADVARLVQRI